MKKPRAKTPKPLPDPRSTALPYVKDALTK